MRRSTIALLLALMMLCPTGLVHSYTYQYTDTTATVQVRWPTNTITIALSTSLSSPPPNIKAGSDVIGAARRALRRWSDVTNIQFVETSSNLQSVSASGSGGDGVSLITVADTPDNRALFSSSPSLVGRTRIFRSGGSIAEADIALNPAQQFSTDGTNNTYDIEATLVHELGHLLGLEHSGVIGATMQPRQGTNGFYSVPNTTSRTLADDDRVGIRGVYGQRPGADATGAISGTVTYNGGVPVYGAHVFVENAASGRVAGGNVTKIDGSYRIDGLLPGTYRVVAEYLDNNRPVRASDIASQSGAYNGISNSPAFRTAEGQASVNAGAVTNANLAVLSLPPSLTPRVFGTNFFLATAPLPLNPGSVQRFFIGGDGIDQVPATGFSVRAPFMSIDPASYQVENSANFGVSYPIVSFNLAVGDSAKVGEFSVRLQANSGEIAYLSGAITVDPYTNQPQLNPIDDPTFFVTLQYRDFLFREPEPAGLNSWLTCMATRADCDRIEVSASFFRSQEFVFKGFFVYRFYTVSFGQRPSYAQIIPDMQFVTGQTADEVTAKRNAFTDAWVTRPAFANIYNGLSNSAYVDRLLQTEGVGLTTPDPVSGVTRNSLIDDLNAQPQRRTRAQVLRAIAESQEVANKEFNMAFVAMQYYGYLKRDPELDGYQAWLNVINRNPNDYRTMVGGFSNSKEYRSRFGEP